MNFQGGLAQWLRARVGIGRGRDRVQVPVGTNLCTFIYFSFFMHYCMSCSTVVQSVIIDCFLLHSLLLPCIFNIPSRSDILLLCLNLLHELLELMARSSSVKPG